MTKGRSPLCLLIIRSAIDFVKVYVLGNLPKILAISFEIVSDGIFNSSPISVSGSSLISYTSSLIHDPLGFSQFAYVVDTCVKHYNFLQSLANYKLFIPPITFILIASFSGSLKSTVAATLITKSTFSVTSRYCSSVMPRCGLT